MLDFSNLFFRLTNLLNIVVLESDDELNDEFGAESPFIQVGSPVLPPIFSVSYFDPANSIHRFTS